PAMLNVVCSRLVQELSNAGNASTYVDFSLESWRYSNTSRGTSCSPASPSSTSTAVEVVLPLPYLNGFGKLSLLNSTSLSCLGELILNSTPALSQISRALALTSRSSRCDISASTSQSSLTPASSMRASTGTSGRSISSYTLRSPALSTSSRNFSVSRSVMSAASASDAPSFRLKWRSATSRKP